MAEIKDITPNEIKIIPAKDKVVVADVGTGLGAVIGDLGSRSASTVTDAINTEGNLVNDVINARLDTQAKTILDSFTFGVSGAITIQTDENNGLWISPTGILGKKAGITTFALTNEGDATYAGTLSASQIITGILNASLITVSNLVVGTNVELGTAKQVFTTTPTTPYYVGDLWSAGSTGDLKVCITQKLIGSYDSADWGLASKYTDDTLLGDFIAGVYTTDIGYLQNQLDGVVVNWFYEGEPTLENEPAVNWTTDELKDNHLGDLYYNLISGYAYRFIKDVTYQWYNIPDAGVAEALAAAAAAQDTADSKRQVFTATPTTPYNVGDLWLTSLSASVGDFKKCITEKLTGAYEASHWVIASKYTEGADWGANLLNIPATLGTVSAAGLYLSTSKMGYYTGSSWNAYIDNSGNFYFRGDDNSSIDWNITTPATLTIKGKIVAGAGSSVNGTYLASASVPGSAINPANFISTPSDENLVGYWSFDDATGTLVKDTSQNTNNGTITGATFVDGVSGKGLSFDGVSDYVNLGASILTGTVSISMWVNIDDMNRNEFMMIGTGDGSNNNLWYFSKDLNNLSIGWRTDNGGIDRRVYLAHSGIISAGSWYHIVAVIDSVGGTHKIYINGVEKRNDPKTYTVGIPGSPTYISFNHATQAFKGKIDEVRIYNKVLTLNEIQALYLYINPNAKNVITAQRIAVNTLTAENILTLNMVGKSCTFDTGFIGGWSLSTTALYYDGATDALSAGMASADYPFYAGKKYANRATAPFRVTQAGALVATSATITGAIQSGSTITGTTITGGTFQTATSGQRVVIAGATNDISIYSSISQEGTISGLSGVGIAINGLPFVALRSGGTTVAAVLSSTSFGFFSSDVLPSGTCNLGSSTYKWANIYLSGNITVGGTVDGVDISSHVANASAHHSSTSNALAITPSSVVASGNVKGSSLITTAGLIYYGSDVVFDIYPADNRSGKHLVPIGLGNELNVGSASLYWHEVNYLYLTKRGGLGVFDEGVELQDGKKVSDLEAILNLKAHPTMKSQFGVPRVDPATLPKIVYRPAPIAEEDIKEKDKLIYKKGEKIGEDGEEMGALTSIMIGAIKELNKRLEKLEKGL